MMKMLFFFVGKRKGERANELFFSCCAAFCCCYVFLLQCFASVVGMVNGIMFTKASSLHIEPFTQENDRDKHFSNSEFQLFFSALISI
jgi:hypothetical protein